MAQITIYSKAIGDGVLLIIINSIFAIMWEKQCFYVFDSQSRDENGIVSASGTAVLLKFDILRSLRNYMEVILLFKLFFNSILSSAV